MEIDRIEELQDDDEKWSVSKLQTILACGAKYKYKYIDRIEEQKTGALIFGSAVHKCIETMHKENIFDEGRVQRLWDTTWYEYQREFDWETERTRKSTYESRGLKMLEDYASEHSNDIVEGTEVKFEVRLDDIILKGILDKVQRISLDPGIPHEKGQLAVIDYKTGKNPPDPLVLQRDYQMGIYSWAAEQVLGEPVIMGLHHLLTNQIYWTFKHDIEPIRRAIQRGRRIVAEQDFDRHISWACKFCPFKDYCLTGGDVQVG